MTPIADVLDRAATLDALAERVEALTEASREVDACVAAALRVGTDQAWAANYPDWIGRADGRVYLEEGGPSFASPLFTASLDAAMSLAEGLEQFGGPAGMLREAMDRLWLASLPGTQPYTHPKAFGEALARFVTAACLRAHASLAREQSA